MFEKSKKSSNKSRSETRSETYRIRDSSTNDGVQGASESSSSNLERGRQNRPKTLSISVIFLDGSQTTFEVEKSAKGSVLLDKVFKHLELVERDYFGLQFDELLPPPEIVHPLSSPHLRWIESSKSLKKQLNLRFSKSSASSSTKKHSLISTTSSDSNSLQAQQSNGVPKSNSGPNPSATVYFRVKFFVEDPARLNEEYTRYHLFLQVRKDIKEGRMIISPSTACLLASYAIQSEAGDFNPEEMDEFGDYLQNMNELTSLKACGSTMEELTLKSVHLHKMHSGQTPADAEYNYLDHAKRLEGYGVSFHRVKDNSGKEIQIGINHAGISVYHLNVRINIFSWSKITKLAFKRKNFFLQLRRELSEDYDTLLVFDCYSYRSCKNLWKCSVENHSFFRLSAPPQPNRRPNLLLLGFGSRFRYSGRTEYQTREETCSRRERERKTFFRSQNKKLQFFRQTLRGLGHSGVGGTDKDKEKSIEIDGVDGLSKTEMRNNAINVSSKVGSSLRLDNKVTSNEKEPRKAWAENPSPESDGGFDKSGIMRTIVSTHPNIPIKIPYADDDENSISDDGTLSIYLEPDPQGKFGFNIKGGNDIGCPVLVSRVAPSTPAEISYPRLNEGDHIIQINGRDTGIMSHKEVVNCIRNAASINKELHLRVRQNVYEYSTEDYEEPSFQYVPDIPLLHNNNNKASQGEQSALGSSMLLLSEAIESNQISSQFELVYRRKPGLNTDAAKMLENLSKNRYRDILPYDSTRVILNDSPSGDYINASAIKMEITASGIVNRYIATQGPLSSTTADFWIMIWESQSPLIVMLTPICERGRIKCHTYWPQILNSSAIYHNLQVILTKETDKGHWMYREFIIKHTETEEERVVSHYQYVSWPDHGVPDDPFIFIRFMEEIRRVRAGIVEPMVVHCSAGIGRTGVLILMETAECLIEANQPIYPLEIVEIMRNQRPLMIQTSSQYRFVCECVLKVFERGMIRPLPEFSTISPTVSNNRRSRSSRLIPWLQNEKNVLCT